MMSILVGQNTRLLCQGMTGWAGTYHTNRMIQYGTKVVAGVTPGKGGKSHLDVPIFDSVAEAVRTTGAGWSRASAATYWSSRSRRWRILLNRAERWRRRARGSW